MLKIHFCYFSKEEKVVHKLSDAAGVLIIGEKGFDAFFPIDTESTRKALPKDLSGSKYFYSFTEKEWAAFDAEFDVGQHDEDEEETEEEKKKLKTAASAGEKFKPDTWEEPNYKGFKMDKDPDEEKDKKPKEEKSQGDHARTKEEINLIKYIEYMGPRIASLEHNKRVIAYIDSKKGDVSEEVLAKVHSLVPAIMTNEDFKKDSWKTREGQKLRVSKAGYIRKDHAIAIKKAWNNLPDSFRDCSDELVLRSTDDSEWTPGSYRDSTGVLTIRTNAGFKYDQEYLHNLMTHEAEHCQWHRKATDEQKKEWIKRIMVNPKLRYATSYSKKHFDKYDKILKKYKYGDHPLVKIYWDKAFNELHSEVSAWTKYPKAKGSNTKPNHELIKEAGVIFMEIFG